MKVTINKDEKTVTDLNGNIYEIAGLLIRKPKSKDVFYGPDSPMCKAVVFRGLEEEAIDLGNGKVNLV